MSRRNGVNAVAMANTRIRHTFGNTVLVCAYRGQPSLLQQSAQRVPSLPSSARVIMDVLTPTEAHIPTVSSSYVELFAQITSLQSKGDYYGLIQAAERADLAVCLPSCYRTHCKGLTLLPLAQGNKRYSSYTTSHHHSPRALLSDS